MGLRISTNVASISAQRVLQKQEQKLTHSQEALASGSRIVNASDDAAGLAISENLRGQIAGIHMAKQNANNAESLIQTSEGGLNEINNILIRLRELGVQAASDTVSEKERGFIDKEAQQLLQESDRIAKSTRFGERKLLDGSGGELEFHVGAYSDPDENVIRYSMDADATNSALGIDGISLTDKDGARDSLDAVDSAVEKLGQMRADFGAVQSRLHSTVSNLGVQDENLSAAKSQISDADIADESAKMASAQVLRSASIAVLAQANQNGATALRLLS